MGWWRRRNRLPWSSRGDEMEYLRKACERISDEELPDDMWATVSRIYDFIQEK